VWVFEAGKDSTYFAITIDKATGLPLASSQSGKWLDATATYEWVRTSGINDSEVSVPSHFRQEDSLLYPSQRPSRRPGVIPYQGDLPCLRRASQRASRYFVIVGAALRARL
jgi:hypothetical protein